MKFGTCLLRVAYVSVALVMVSVLFRQHDLVVDVSETVDPVMVLAASVILFFYRIVNASVWGVVLCGLGASVSKVAATRVWLNTEALRWLPGGIWGFCSRVTAAQRLGLSKSLASLSLSVELLITILAWGVAMTAGLWFSGLLPRLYGFVPDGIVMLVCLGTIGLLLGLWLFRACLMKTAWVQRLSLVRECQVCRGDLMFALVAYAVLCVVNGLGFYLLLQAFPQGGGSVSLLAAIGVNAAGWLAGFFAVGAPGGLGAREAALVAMLSPFMSLEVVVLFVAAWRLLQMLVEAVALATVEATRRMMPVSCSVLRPVA